MTQDTVAAQPILPPPYTPLRLREFGDAFAHALSIAPECGAGTLVYVGRFDLAEFAVVLEPSEPFSKARRVFYAGMAAVADALATTAPAETAIQIEWPGALYVNWALVGGGRLGWPKGADETAVPEWLVFGATIRTAWTQPVDPGLSPAVTALNEEGFAEVTSNHIIESFARNLMHGLDAWQERGFAEAIKPYLERLARENNQNCEIDENGDLVLHQRGADDKTERKLLLPRLTAPAWLDVANT